MNKINTLSFLTTKSGILLGIAAIIIIVETLYIASNCCSSPETAPLSTRQDADIWYNSGIALQDQGKNTEAIESYDNAIEIDPKYVGAWHMRGLAFSKLGNFGEAIKSYDKAIEISARYPDIWQDRGFALYELGLYDDAIDSFDRVIEVEPQFSSAWHNKGLALEKLGRYEEAVKSFDKAIEIDPKYASAWYNKSLALGKLGRDEEAKKALVYACEKDPNFCIEPPKLMPEQESPGYVITGPCSYEKFRGECKITSICRTEQSKLQAANLGYEGFEVKFRFISDKPLNIENVKWIQNVQENILNQEYRLLMGFSWYPGQRYLEKYNITENASFGCELLLITNGSCSPTGFNFDAINLTDYFEIGR